MEDTMEYDVTQYPEGYEKFRDEELGFLPEIPEVKDQFMLDYLQWLIQW